MKLLLILLNVFIFAQGLENSLSYSLEDINSTSDTYGQNISPSSFENKITVNYFGHQN